MKYKTLFRLALRILGVYLLVTATIQLPWNLLHHWSTISAALNPNPNQIAVAGLPRGWPYALTGPIHTLLEFAAGFYLFFGGEWIVNKAIPSNRAYCHECGYMLKNLTGTRCPECDTPFRPDPAPTTPPREGA